MKPLKLYDGRLFLKLYLAGEKCTTVLQFLELNGKGKGHDKDTVLINRGIASCFERHKIVVDEVQPT
jgi:hypothetical protein